MKLIILIIVLSLSVPLFAFSPSCSKGGTIAIYSNGLDSTRTQTFKSINLLIEQQEYLNSKIDRRAETKENHVTYTYLHNARFQNNATDESIILRYSDYIGTTIYLVQSTAKQRFGINYSTSEVISFVLDLTGQVTSLAAAVYSLNPVLTTIILEQDKKAFFSIALLGARWG